MVYVPAGEFTMGRNDGTPRQAPMRSVFLDGFWISKTEVTVAQFRAYCEEPSQSEQTRQQRYDPWNFDPLMSPDWGWPADYPMVNVNWQEARAFCKWAGGDLPTEAQWEKAARGTDGRIYPWGNQFDASLCRGGTPDILSTPLPAGSFPGGESPYGCLDMAGNVLEWVLDAWTTPGGEADPQFVPGYEGLPSQNPIRDPEMGPMRVVRGGCYLNKTDSQVRSDHRYGSVLSDRVSLIGFRLVTLDAQPGQHK